MQRQDILSEMQHLASIANTIAVTAERFANSKHRAEAESLAMNLLIEAESLYESIEGDEEE